VPRRVAQDERGRAVERDTRQFPAIDATGYAHRGRVGPQVIEVRRAGIDEDVEAGGRGKRPRDATAGDIHHAQHVVVQCQDVDLAVGGRDGHRAGPADARDRAADAH
jgi:hypothetical protein